MVKNPPASVGYKRSIPGPGRSSGGGNGNPLQYSCLGKPHGQRSLVGYSSRGHKESVLTQQLDNKKITCIEFIHYKCTALEYLHLSVSIGNHTQIKTYNFLPIRSFPCPLISLYTPYPPPQVLLVFKLNMNKMIQCVLVFACLLSVELLGKFNHIVRIFSSFIPQYSMVCIDQNFFILLLLLHISLLALSTVEGLKERVHRSLGAALEVVSGSLRGIQSW